MNKDIRKNKKKKNKIRPRNPLSYSYVRHNIILGQD